MDPRLLETLAKRLGENPNDTEALNVAYEQGQADPRSYAVFLEKAGAASADAVYAAHWLNEAATVWSVSLGDQHRAARILMAAVDRDPTSSVAADRLLEMYREKGDHKSVAALFDRRTKHLEKLVGAQPELALPLAQVYADLAQLYLAELGQPERAIGAYQRAVRYNPGDAYSIYQARELLKGAQRFKEALPYFQMEQELIAGDGERQLALYLDEAEVARQLGDATAQMRALRGARTIDQTDATLMQQVATVVFEQIQAGRSVPVEDRQEAGALFTSLAETYDGEHGHAYALCALACDPGIDRAAQLGMHYAAQLGREAELAHPLATYLAVRSEGPVADDARRIVARALTASPDDALIAALTPREDAPATARIGAHLDIARALSAHGRSEDASRHYRSVLALDAANSEAVNFVAERLRSKGQHGKLRDLLLMAARQPEAPTSDRQAWLREVVGLCEGPLRDVDGSIEASRQLVMLDPSDSESADHLEVTLEKAAKWTELAELVERRAELDDDDEQKRVRYRRAADLHLERRKDPVAAAAALSIIARLDPDDDETTFEAIVLYERARQADLAIALLREMLSVSSLTSARVRYSQHLGQLLEAGGYFPEAGGAYAEAAAGTRSPELWQKARRAFVSAEAWEQAARSVSEERALGGTAAHRALLAATEADYWERLGDGESVLRLLSDGLALDATNDTIAARLAMLLVAEERYSELVQAMLTRASAHPDRQKRVALRRDAALLQRDRLDDIEGMRSALTELLEDGDDVEALSLLAADAEESGETTEAIAYLRRWQNAVGGDARAEVALRLAKLLEAEGDQAAALDEYFAVLVSRPNSAFAVANVARLQEALEQPAAAAETLGRLIPLVSGDELLSAARRRADLLATLGQRDVPSAVERRKEAITAYQAVLELDTGDYEVVEILRDLCRDIESWEEYVGYQAQLIEVEGDETEASKMVLELAHVLSERLERPRDAMAALAPLAKEQVESCRDEYIRLGDELGLEGEVAEALVEWSSDAPAGPKRNAALRAAYARFSKVGKAAPAISVGLELVRMKGAKQELAESLERIASGEKHVEAILAAFVVLERDLTGPARAEELVRQAEVLAKAEMPAKDAILHGEQALTSVDPHEVGPLLDRLAALASDPAAKVLVYERQVPRCKSPDDRQQALVRAAEVASSLDQEPRVRQFFELALGIAGPGEALLELRTQVKEADLGAGSTRLRRTFAECLSEAGTDIRDGGKGRGVFLSCAASIANEDLADGELSLKWLGDALIAHVEEEYLDQLEQMTEARGQLELMDSTIERALGQVVDGPLVRMLLGRRYDLRVGRLANEQGAAEDLKRLYDLSPTDSEIAAKLEDTYLRAENHRGLVHLYEDQILRSRDKTIRIDLSRKVARIWQDVLHEPRETADAWRRVLRLSSADTEAKEGLDRAKLGMRKVTVADLTKSEEETRVQVEAAQVREQAEQVKREAELLVKARGIRQRHSQPPPPVALIEEAPSSADEDDAGTENLATAAEDGLAPTSPAIAPEEAEAKAAVPEPAVPEPAVPESSTSDAAPPAAQAEEAPSAAAEIAAASPQGEPASGEQEPAPAPSVAEEFDSVSPPSAKRKGKGKAARAKAKAEEARVRASARPAAKPAPEPPVGAEVTTPFESVTAEAVTLEPATAEPVTVEPATAKAPTAEPAQEAPAEPVRVEAAAAAEEPAHEELPARTVPDVAPAPAATAVAPATPAPAAEDEPADEDVAASETRAKLDSMTEEVGEVEEATPTERRSSLPPPPPRRAPGSSLPPPPPNRSLHLPPPRPVMSAPPLPPAGLRGSLPPPLVRPSLPPGLAPRGPEVRFVPPPPGARPAGPPPLSAPLAPRVPPPAPPGRTPGPPPAELSRRPPPPPPNLKKS